MHKTWALILIGVVIVLVGVSAFLYGQNQGVRKNGAATTEDTSLSQNNNPTSLQASPSVTESEEFAPSVVIESEGLLPPQDVSEIKARIIAPYIDFNNESQPGELVSFKVTQNLNPSKNEFPYVADAIFKSGGNEGFLISKTNGHINWYIPECLNGCQFSEEFSAKYPEIVELSQ